MPPRKRTAHASAVGEGASTTAPELPVAPASIFDFVTAPRVTLLAITPIVAANVLHLAPRDLEPLYGNVFASLHFTTGVLVSLMSGVIGALILARMSSVEQSATMATIAGVDRVGLMLAAAPGLVRAFSLASSLGPYVGPHFTQGFYAYAAVFLLAFSNAMACTRQTKHERAAPLSRWVAFCAMYAWIIAALTRYAEGVVANMNPRGSCLKIQACAGLMSGVGLVFKVLVYLFGKIEMGGEGGRRSKGKKGGPSNKKDNEQRTINALGQIFVFGLVVYNVYFTPVCNTNSIEPFHTSTNATYAILARNESVTGWIEVVEERTPRQMRLLRAGHSLIGGVHKKTWESVYASFYFMEGVRLVEGRTKTREKGLQIGLGVGISAASLQLADVDLDIVEIDPVVYQYALDYFRLNYGHRIYIQDGRKFLESAPADTYDYVLHDVFTGGSVPRQLFSVAALEHVQRVLKPDGVLALNFVGALKWPGARHSVMVYNTIRRVFPHIRCFHEGWSEKASAENSTDYNLENMVFYASHHPLVLRRPHSGDTHGTHMRGYILENMEQWEVDIERLKDEVRSRMSDSEATIDEGKWDVVDVALAHWQAMREVAPAEFWYNY